MPDLKTPLTTASRTNPAVAAIEYAINGDSFEAMTFLRLWFQGDFDVLRKEWPDAPAAIYQGADPLLSPPPEIAAKDAAFDVHLFQHVQSGEMECSLDDDAHAHDREFWHKSTFPFTANGPAGWVPIAKYNESKDQYHAASSELRQARSQASDAAARIQKLEAEVQALQQANDQHALNASTAWTRHALAIGVTNNTLAQLEKLTNQGFVTSGDTIEAIAQAYAQGLFEGKWCAGAKNPYEIGDLSIAWALGHKDGQKKLAPPANTIIGLTHDEWDAFCDKHGILISYADYKKDLEQTFAQKNG